MPTRSPSADAPTPDLTPVTGVARGNLGTATNLDDTQVYALDELRAAAAAAPADATDAPPAAVPIAAPDSGAPEFESAAEPPPVVPIRAQTLDPQPRPEPVRPRAAVIARRSMSPRGNPGRRTGLIAAAAVAAILGGAVLLTVRDGSLGGPGSAGAGSGGAVVVPSSVVPTEPPAATPPPKAGGGGGGGGNGRGGGNGHGNGHGN